MGMLRVLSQHGDDQFAWDQTAVAVGDAEAVAAVREAERIFETERARGATAVRMTPGKAAERIDVFDPSAHEIVMVPRVVGG